MAANADSIRRFLKIVIASIASMATHRNLGRLTLLESFLAPSLNNGLNFHCTRVMNNGLNFHFTRVKNNGLNFHCTRVMNNQICELLPSLNSYCEGA